MELRVIASGSEGNAYVIQNAGEALLLEAGVGIRQILPEIGYDTGKVRGVLISHEHGDHARGVADLLDYGLPVYASRGTITGMERHFRGAERPAAFRKTGDSYERLTLGGFTIMPFPTEHDAQEPTGFYIFHEETGGILFATDTYYLRNTFGNLSNILIECNYSAELLERNFTEGRISQARYKRVRESHMSLETCVDTLLANDLRRVNNIVLIHLSRDNGSAGEFRSSVAAATGRSVTVATAGMIMPFNEAPF